MTKAGRIFDKILLAGISISCAIILFQTLVVNGDVFMRYVFSDPIVWGEELSEYGLLYLTFLGAAWVLKKGGHLRMDMLFNRFRPKAQIMVDIFLNLVGAGIAGLFVWYGVTTSLEYYQRGIASVTSIQIPLAPVLMVIPVGSLLYLIQSLRMSYNGFIKWKDLP